MVQGGDGRGRGKRRGTSHQVIAFAFALWKLSFNARVFCCVIRPPIFFKEIFKLGVEKFNFGRWGEGGAAWHRGNVGTPHLTARVPFLTLLRLI